METREWLVLPVVLVMFLAGYWFVGFVVDMLKPGKRTEGEPAGGEGASGRPEGCTRPPVPEQEAQHHASVLGVSGNASAEEVRKAYLEMSGRYHPDKVAHLGREFREMAERKSLEIQEAYEYFMARLGHPRSGEGP